MWTHWSCSWLNFDCGDWVQQNLYAKYFSVWSIVVECLWVLEYGDWAQRDFDQIFLLKDVTPSAVIKWIFTRSLDSNTQPPGSIRGNILYIISIGLNHYGRNWAGSNSNGSTLLAPNAKYLIVILWQSFIFTSNQIKTNRQHDKQYKTEIKHMLAQIWFYYILSLPSFSFQIFLSVPNLTAFGFEFKLILLYCAICITFCNIYHLFVIFTTVCNIYHLVSHCVILIFAILSHCWLNQ